MIISASRRTDIPAFYTDWFLKRIQEGFVYVRNPLNPHQVSQVDLSPEQVDCIVFWSKNPKPMLEQLHRLNDYKYLFQFTLNAYKTDIEGQVPQKNGEVIETFKRLSEHIGKEKVIWRYDPIVLTSEYSEDYHLFYFEKLAKALHGFTDRCVFSFVDEYAKINQRLKQVHYEKMGDETMRRMACEMSKVASAYGLTLVTCSELIDLEAYGIQHAKCIDAAMISKVVGYELAFEKDKNQREQCGCAASIDIGAYNTCRHGCVYCYANHSERVVSSAVASYDVNSPVLCSSITEMDHISVSKVKASQTKQISFL